MTLAELVSALPELYQPIYGHPEFDPGVSRASADRLQAVLMVIQRLGKHLARPLRVLDLGCAQGFFSLSAAAHGAWVIGIDRVPENIAVCTALAQEHPNLELEFRCGRVEDTLKSLRPGQFDLVVCLSVLHHLCLELSAPAVRALVASIVNKTEAAIFEIALKNEPVVWGRSQPADYHWLLEDFPFLITLSTYPTHLSDLPRPMVFASKRIWLLGQDIRTFNGWSACAHELAEGDDNCRRYYFADGVLAKVVRFTGLQGSQNRLELENERKFLTSPPPGFPHTPRLLDCGSSTDEGWIVREMFSGQILSNVIAREQSFDPGLILDDVLLQLSALELAGQFHDDLRIWNTLLLSDGHAILIDYGSISTKKQDREWPHDIYLSFLLFVHEIFRNALPRTRPTRSPLLIRSNLPTPYDVWMRHIWNSQSTDWNFSTFREKLQRLKEGGLPHVPRSPTECWMVAAEEFLESYISRYEQKIHDLEQDLRQHISVSSRRREQFDRDLQFLSPVIRLARKLFGQRT